MEDSFEGAENLKNSIASSRLMLEASIADSLASDSFTVSFPEIVQHRDGSSTRVSIRAFKWILDEVFGFIQIELVINCYKGENVLVFTHPHKQPDEFPFLSLLHANPNGANLLQNALKNNPNELYNTSIFSNPKVYGFASTLSSELDTFSKDCIDCYTVTQNNIFRASIDKYKDFKTAVISIPIVIVGEDIIAVEGNPNECELTGIEEAIVLTGLTEPGVIFPSVRLYTYNHFIESVSSIAAYTDLLINKLNLASKEYCSPEYGDKSSSNKVQTCSQEGDDTQRNSSKKQSKSRTGIGRFFSSIVFGPKGLILVALVFLIYLVFTILFPTTLIKPHLEVLASITLLWITLVYAYAAYLTMTELKIQRIDSMKPILVLRYLIDNLDSSSSLTRESIKSTRLVNIGPGPAMNINAKSNLVFDHSGIIHLHKYESQLKAWPDNNISFGASLGSESGNQNLQICFIKTDYRSNFYTPIQDYNAIIHITYDDIYGNAYSFHLEQCRQEISSQHGAMNSLWNSSSNR